MKLKQQPSDFRVEELTDTQPGNIGRFALYRLDKTGWTTPDALQVIQRAWQLQWRNFGYGGLKDRHAVTSQFITIFRGPTRDFQEQRLSLQYLGEVENAFDSRQIRANKFSITLRAMTPDEVASVERRIERIRECGVPNYFDDQRFGSVTADGRFIGRELVFGRYEVGLKMALTEPYDFDRKETKEEKRLLIEHWGDWKTLKEKLSRGHARSLIDYLIHHPTDFKGAVERLRPELQGIYLSAYQSELWNRILARWITARGAEGGVTMHRGILPCPTSRIDGTLSLPCPRMKPDENAEWYPHMEAVLAEEGVTYKKLKLPGLNKPYFSKGERIVTILPKPFDHAVGDDELNNARQKITLCFELPRGAYATMVVKFLTGQNVDSSDE